MNKKCQRWCAVAIVGAVVILGVSAACIWKSRSAQTVNSNIFDPTQVKIGDEVSGFKITSITRSSSDEVGDGATLRVKFSGTATLAGKYNYQMNEFAGMQTACFQPSDTNTLPVFVQNSDRNKAFCFRDLKKFQDFFGKKYGMGDATIVINNYELADGSEALNSADLVSVVSK